jgi:hypothetical protein
MSAPGIPALPLSARWNLHGLPELSSGASRAFNWEHSMLKIVTAVAALAVIGFVAPSIQTANAETIVVKKDHDRDWHRHHHKKIVVIKGHHDHD